METEIGSRGSTYPNLAMGSTTASRSGEDVLLGGANVPGGGPAVKRHNRRRGRELGGKREEEDEGAEETMRRGAVRWEGKTYIYQPI